MIEKAIKWIAAFIISVILQSTFIPVIAIFGIQPDLPMIVLFFMCLRHGVLPGVYVGFILGVSLDLYSPALLGQHALAKTVIGFFMGLFNEKVMRTDPILKVVILAVTFLIHDTLFAGAELLKHGSSVIQIFPELLLYTLPRTVYSIVFIFLIHLWNTTILPNLRR